jgi:hypothetical protein
MAHACVLFSQALRVFYGRGGGVRSACPRVAMCRYACARVYVRERARVCLPLAVFPCVCMCVCVCVCVFAFVPVLECECPAYELWKKACVS